MSGMSINSSGYKPKKTYTYGDLKNAVKDMLAEEFKSLKRSKLEGVEKQVPEKIAEAIVSKQALKALDIKTS